MVTVTRWHQIQKYHHHQASCDAKARFHFFASNNNTWFLEFNSCLTGVDAYCFTCLSKPIIAWCHHCCQCLTLMCSWTRPPCPSWPAWEHPEVAASPGGSSPTAYPSRPMAGNKRMSSIVHEELILTWSPWTQQKSSWSCVGTRNSLTGGLASGWASLYASSVKWSISYLGTGVSILILFRPWVISFFTQFVVTEAQGG